MTSSSWRERFERLGPIRTVDLVPFGSPATLVLRPEPDRAAVRSVSATLALCRRGATMLRAKRALEAMLDEGRAVIEVPRLEDAAALARDLAEHGVGASLIGVEEVSAKDVRTGLGLTQEQFALRYGLDLDTLQNWEAGRRRPDAAVRSYLKVIARLPDAAGEALEDGIPRT